MSNASIFPVLPKPRSSLPSSILYCGLALRPDDLSPPLSCTKTYYIGSYAQDREKQQKQRLLLSTIPEDASVKSTTFFIPQLSGRDEIYLADSRHPADYIVLDQRPGYEKDSRPDG